MVRNKEIKHGVSFEHEVNRSVLKNSSVRFADNIAILVALSINKALEKIVVPSHQLVAVVTNSNFGTIGTMRDLLKDSKLGMVSPLKFPAASPGSLAGLSCILNGFKGPSINFTMTLDEGSISLLTHLANEWIRLKKAELVIISNVISKNELMQARPVLVQKEDLNKNNLDGLFQFLLGTN